MHPRNRHQDRYDFKQLIKSCPELSPYVATNEYGSETINFADPEAVKFLNKAILKNFYRISSWDIPKNSLCPPIPGRADYVHYIADLIPKHRSVVGLDIGVGANCVYPLIGHSEYQWSFIGTDINQKSLESAKKNVENNSLQEFIELRHQEDKSHIFVGVIGSGEEIDFTMCNPPFHASAEEAAAGSQRKNKNLGLKTKSLNFGGENHELWCPGGEKAFIQKMIEESSQFAQQCLWFTTLVSKKENLKALESFLHKVKAQEIKIVEMSQGQKISRMLAWTFQTKTQQQAWAKKRWI